MSACIKDHAIPLTRLEKITGSNAGSNTKIIWSDELKEDFEKARSSLKTIQSIYTPRPSDKLQTYSDYSQEHKAVGGQLIILRK